MSGDEVLDTIAERGIDPAVVMVTAVDPDFDIVEMPFDEYLTKPVTARTSSTPSRRCLSEPRSTTGSGVLRRSFEEGDTRNPEEHTTTRSKR